MASVGSVSCTFVKGNAQTLAERVETWQVPGLAGYGVQQQGAGDATFRFVAYKIDLKANVDTWISQIQGQKGQVISIIDDWGVTHSSLVITQLGQPVKRAARDPGGAYDCVGTIEIDGIKAV